MQEYGAQQSDGRVPIPAVMVLDEAANICKLQQPVQQSGAPTTGVAAAPDAVDDIFESEFFAEGRQ